MDNQSLICSVCHQAILPEYYFCPNCGNNLKEKLIKIPIINQIGIYALSIFLPPLGLWPGLKYLKKTNPNAKQIGIIAILLTIASSAITIWEIFHIFQNYLNQLNSLMY